MSRCAASASFSSRSSRFSGPMAATAPDPGQYAVYDVNTMAASATKLHSNPSFGAFGGQSSRELPWKREIHESVENVAPIRSSFGSGSRRNSSPSAAFSGAGNRFAAPKEGTPGPGSYASTRSPLSPSTRLNRSASFGSRSRRFNTVKVTGPNPGAYDPKPGAFASALQKPRSQDSGFGSRSRRGSPFATADAENNAPAPGTYDASASTGAFAGASSARGSKGSVSAAFASRSSRFDRPGSASQSAGPDPTAYSPAAYGSMAQVAVKTFNKNSTRGGSGFGTSARRPDVTTFGTQYNRQATPGPGQYDESNRAGSSRTRASSPSSAFASRTPMHDSYHLKTAAPAATEYDAHRGSGMAAAATKSFNKLAGTGKFGPRAARALEATPVDESPAPGAYTAQDPTRPTCTATAMSSHGRPSSAFSSKEERDTSRWTGAGRD